MQERDCSYLIRDTAHPAWSWISALRDSLVLLSSLCCVYFVSVLSECTKELEELGN